MKLSVASVSLLQAMQNPYFNVATLLLQTVVWL